MIKHILETDVIAVMSDGSDELRRDVFESRSVQLSRLLTQRGLKEGDRVAIMLENSLDWLTCMWGVRRAGMFFVPVNWHLTPGEIRYIVENSQARAIITSDFLGDRAEEAIRGIGEIEIRLSVSEGDTRFQSLYPLLGTFSSTPPDSEFDGGMMPYSSGTSGRPKGILRPLTGTPFGQAPEMEKRQQQLLGLDADTIYLSPAPFYHSAPLSWSGSVIQGGGKVVMMPSFDGEAALAAIEKYRITHAQFVPTHFVRMLRARAESSHSFDISSLKAIVHAAAPCPPDVKRQMIDWLGPIVHEYYGGSERSGMTYITAHDWLEHPGSVGRSITGPIRIVNPDSGVEVPQGTVGQIYFENPAAFTYHGDPEKTAAAFNGSGWGTYGDLGHVDRDGYLYIADRRTDLIVSGGVNIYPQEIENVLITHDLVVDVAVIGVPHPEFGQSVRAIVQIDPHAPVPNVSQLLDFCRSRLAGYKVPRSIEFTQDLPRLPSGKLLRRVLVERYRQLAAD